MSNKLCAKKMLKVQKKGILWGWFKPKASEFMYESRPMQILLNY